MAEEIENDNSPIVEEENNTEEETVVEDNETTEEKPKIEYTEREKQLYAQLQKAKGLTLVDGKWVKANKPAAKVVSTNLSTTDAILIAKSNIEMEDVERVVKFAKDEGLTVSEALRNSELRAILDVRADERRTAQATQTRSARGSAPQSGEDMLSKAENTGEVPATDEGMRAITEARMARKKANT